MDNDLSETEDTIPKNVNMPLKRISIVDVMRAEQSGQEAPSLNLSEEEERQFESVREQLEANETEALRQALSNISEDASTSQAEAATLTYKKHDWDYIKQVDPKNKWIRLVEQNKDDLMKEALCIVFKALEPAQWQSPQVARLVGKIMRELKDDADYALNKEG